ncbi:unnamed protein product [Acanthoscelides obtectus]|uniref:Uncharacterized protein n=1 Tax=Acanthoscelides obtectus TaxID=200917 RepID=A0A9P0MH55_ACAOB|nr:unnamed protein product [Acanthoscelides obtectus]CAK1622146.1 hypothetical protein AOBTE_LOCUS1333 [Acanthoscelides obtectus]
MFCFQEEISDPYTEKVTFSGRTVEPILPSEENPSNNFGIYKQDGEMRKGKKKTDFCFFCETPVLNFARHITRNHPSEIEVQEILLHPTRSIVRKQLLDRLRKKGNYINSSVACKPVQSLRSAKDLLPCDNCLGFYSRNCVCPKFIGI